MALLRWVNIRTNQYLPRWYVANGEDVTRNCHGERHIDFSITTFGFCDQPEQICPSPCETNQSFTLWNKSVLHPVKQIGLTNRYTENDFGSFRKKKSKHVSQQCQEIFSQPKTSVLNVTKLICQLSSTVQAILPARIPFRYLQQEQILALKL